MLNHVIFPAEIHISMDQKHPSSWSQAALASLGGLAVLHGRGAGGAGRKKKKHFFFDPMWGWVKTLVPIEPQVIAGIYGCSSH